MGLPESARPTQAGRVLALSLVGSGRGRPAPHGCSEAAAHTRSQATGAAGGTRQAPLIRASQPHGGCGFVDPLLASGTPS